VSEERGGDAFPSQQIYSLIKGKMCLRAIYDISIFIKIQEILTLYFRAFPSLYIDTVNKYVKFSN
jgi:hypothetical protein